jgi:serine protease AprX
MKKYSYSTYIGLFLKKNYKYVIPFILIVFLHFHSYGQDSTYSSYRVFFKDKGPAMFIQGSPLYQATLNLFTDRALRRRAKVMPSDSLIAIGDAPIYQPYIDSCLEAGAILKLKLRWKNYIVIICDSLQVIEIEKYSFVKKVQPTSQKMTLVNNESSISAQSVLFDDYNKTLYYENCDAYDYGNSLNQAALLNVTLLHGFGINGKGVIVGFCDSGFRWKKIPSTQRASVITEYDFINSDSSTENKPTDVSDQDFHGTSVFSTVAGFSQGNLIGIAPNADFILSKTENISSERHIEEDNYAAGVEWMESLGADIITSSLGYFNFDSTDSSYSYSELNGHTTIVAQAVNDAVAKGVVCITAAGNSGSAPQTIISPGDADSELTVGATIYDGVTPAGFSSRGPNSEGKIKPDLAAKGVAVIVASAADPNAYNPGNGTSFATPLIAGTVALFLETFPELTPWEVRNYLESTASQANSPDNTLGYGVPNLFKAMEKAGIIISPISTFKMNKFQRIIIYIASSNNINDAELYIRFDSLSPFVKFKLYPTTYKYQYAADIPLSQFISAKADCYVVADDGFGSRRMPYNLYETITIEPNVSDIQCGVDPSQAQELATETNVPYVYPSLIADTRRNIDLVVPLMSASGVHIELYDLLGKNIYSADYSTREEGIASYPIPVNRLVSGSYFLIVTYSGKTTTIPFLIARN